MKNVLLISLNALGDTYLTLSAVSPLKKQFEDLKIDLLANSDASIFYSYFGLDNLILVNKKNYFSIFKSLTYLKNRYDCSFSFFPGRLNTLYSEMTRADKKYYYRNYNKKAFWHDDSQTLYFNGKKTHYVWHPDYNYISRIEAPLNEILKEQVVIKKPLLYGINKSLDVNEKYVIINPSSKDPGRRLTESLIAEILNYYASNKIPVYLLDFDNAFAKDIFLRKLVYKYSDFENLVRFIINSSLFISADSFLIHIADAYRVNTIGIFGPTRPGSVLLNPELKTIKKNPISSLKIIDLIDFLPIK